MLKCSEDLKTQRYAKICICDFLRLLYLENLKLVKYKLNDPLNCSLTIFINPTKLVDLFSFHLISRIAYCKMKYLLQFCNLSNEKHLKKKNQGKYLHKVPKVYNLNKTKCINMQ